ncbi:MAG: L-dopachrome tautomerase-related protein [Paracoccaceae bacterium]
MRMPAILAAGLATLALPAVSDEVETAQLEIVAEFDTGPGNVTVTPEGRIIVSMHQFYAPEVRVYEVGPEGARAPFPTPDWAGPLGEDGIGFSSVLGLRASVEGVVWMLDNGLADGVPARLVGWDTRADTLVDTIEIPASASVEGSFHNDLALDAERPLAYIADLAGALVVVDLETGAARRVLDGHASTAADDVDMVVHGRRLTAPDGTPHRVAVNPITISADNAWVYYGAMHGLTVWRVPTAALADADLGADALAARVERYGAKPPSDGITVDDAGHVYITDTGGNAVGVTAPDGSYRPLVVDPRLEWPDGMSAAPDGWIYVTVNRLNDVAFLNGGETLEPIGPYVLARFRPLAPVTPGR